MSPCSPSSSCRFHRFILLGNMMFPPKMSSFPSQGIILLLQSSGSTEKGSVSDGPRWAVSIVAWDPQASALGSFIDLTNSLTSSSRTLFLLSTSSRERSTLRRLISKAADFFFSFSSSSLSLTTLAQTS